MKDSRWNDEELLHFSNIFHKYNFMTRNNLQTVHDYGTGESYTPVEAHLVLDIERYPGITITELAKDRACSKSAITQAINRLEKKGLVQRAKSLENKKNALLFVTQKGRQLTQSHVLFDITDIQHLIYYLEKHYSESDIHTFFSVLDFITEMPDETEMESEPISENE